MDIEYRIDFLIWLESMGFHSHGFGSTPKWMVDQWCFYGPFSIPRICSITTLWLLNIAMENDPFIDDFPIKTTIYRGFSMAMLSNQMVKQPNHSTMSSPQHDFFGPRAKRQALQSSKDGWMARPKRHGIRCSTSWKATSTSCVGTLKLRKVGK